METEVLFKKYMDLRLFQYLHSPTVRVSPMAVSLKQGERWTEMFLCLFSNLAMVDIITTHQPRGRHEQCTWTLTNLLYFLT